MTWYVFIYYVVYYIRYYILSYYGKLGLDGGCSEAPRTFLPHFLTSPPPLLQTSFGLDLYACTSVCLYVCVYIS